jgi:uncharacterized protein (DUF1501 family)
MNTATRNLSRRAFLKRGACAALGTTGLLSTLAQLRVLAAGVSGQSAFSVSSGDYKALVCVFLYGGNDANNLIVPYEQQAYDNYARSRSILALPRSDVLPISPLGGGNYAFHPAATGLQTLFAERRLAVLANVGTLIAPVTRAEYRSGSAALPAQLFSHSDQSVQWQMALPDSSRKIGWGGRVADLMASLNENEQISMAVSLAGINTWQAGNQTVVYPVSHDGVVGIDMLEREWVDPVRKDAFTGLLELERRNLFERSIAGSTSRTIENNRLIAAALDQTPPPVTPFPETELGRQLRMIARLARIGPTLGFRRQIFFASMGGWDTHDGQIDAHSELVGELAAAFLAFNRATVEYGIEDKATVFTASDFGRTFSTNGKGSDHGWGNHHLVMGGAVQGGRIFGRFPELIVNGPDDTGQGRWIPTTSVDQYSATLARWFGVDASNLPELFPNIGNFASSDLGFMS